MIDYLEIAMASLLAGLLGSGTQAALRDHDWVSLVFAFGVPALSTAVMSLRNLRKDPPK